MQTNSPTDDAVSPTMMTETTNDVPLSDDIEAYARIFEDTLSGIQSGLASMAEILGSLQTPGSDAQHRLNCFSEAARTVNIQRETIATTIKLFIKGKHQVATMSTMIGDAICKLRAVFEEFMKNAWERMRDWAKNVRDRFWKFLEAFWLKHFLPFSRWWAAPCLDCFRSRLCQFRLSTSLGFASSCLLENLKHNCTEIRLLPAETSFFTALSTLRFHPL